MSKSNFWGSFWIRNSDLILELRGGEEGTWPPGEGEIMPVPSTTSVAGGNNGPSHLWCIHYIIFVYKILRDHAWSILYEPVHEWLSCKYQTFMYTYTIFIDVNINDLACVFKCLCGFVVVHIFLEFLIRENYVHLYKKACPLFKDNISLLLGNWPKFWTRGHWGWQCERTILKIFENDI